MKLDAYPYLRQTDGHHRHRPRRRYDAPLLDDAALTDVLRRLPPGARSDLRRLLISDQPDRNAIAEQLLRRRTLGADALADLIDLLTLDADARRRVVRLLGELEAWDCGT